MRILQRLRGLAGLAVVWGLAWIPVGVSIVAIVEGPISDRAIPWNDMPTLALRFGIVGSLCGLAFGLLIALLERRRTFGGLTFGRMAVWGALAGCAFPLMLLGTTSITAGRTEAIVFGVFGSLGMLTSLGTLALARRAPPLLKGASPELLSSGSELT